MSWTRKAPDWPGLYWYRYDGHITVVELVHGSHRLAWHFLGVAEDTKPEQMLGEWWSEPLKKPEGFDIVST